MMGHPEWTFAIWFVMAVGFVEGGRRIVAIANQFIGFIPVGSVAAFVTGCGIDRSNRTYIPLYDILFGFIGAMSSLFIVFDYEGLIWRQGLPGWIDVWVGLICLVFLLEAARRALGIALAVLGALFFSYFFLGPFLPEVLRYRGSPLDFAMNDMFLSTTGIYGTPLGVSTSIIFLFVLFGALLERAGAGKYFIDVAFGAFGRFRGGAAKAAVAASGASGLYSGSSIANTVTTGTFTIPLMKKVGLPAYKAGAIEVAASTNGQLMPPVMGAAAFIMAEQLGLPYIDVVRAAVFPAIISYFALFYVVDLEAQKLGIRGLPKDQLPQLLKTTVRGIHFVAPILVLFYFLLILRRSPILSALYAIEALAVIMLIQKPLIAWFAAHVARRAGQATEGVGDLVFEGFKQGFLDIFDGAVAGARNMIAIGIATAAAGIIVGVVTATGLVSRFTSLIDTLAMGSIHLVLVLTAICCLILGMGLPTTANYILMASLMAPVIVELGGNAGLIFPIIAAHLFVFYFGILADDTPPVGLAAYAAAAIAQSDPIKTGIQGFTYDMRTAILPFVFIFNTELLMISGVAENGDIIWLDDWFKIAFVFAISMMAMFAFAAAVQGWFADKLNIAQRLLLGAVCLFLFLPGIIAEPTSVPREVVQVLVVVVMVVLYVWQHKRKKQHSTVS
ncbi:MAG: TRAP transporter permease [Rhodospirillaceae bacterium]|nr:TRAP transporter permease [Rhodospirillaceae bacterium]MBT6203822.1 TRAP transporter permease [Rhodospirillaceae bacterium]MBT6510896.1 TRAP transporter permease [Rhodospirillaceae bacterium]MBT7611747.1 TRAP transporter permease [Rhodospirillaceae bacterium]